MQLDLLSVLCGQSLTLSFSFFLFSLKVTFEILNLIIFFISVQVAWQVPHQNKVWNFSIFLQLVCVQVR